MGISVIPGLFDEGSLPASDDSCKTLADVRKTGKNYRHPDSALIRYPLVVADEEGIGSVPIGDDYLNIAIIGAGVAGIASCYELSRLGNMNRIKLTMYEADPANCIFTSDATQFALDTEGKKAGRVFAARSYDITDNLKHDHTVYEIGAMRFPEIAGLTWHYVGEVYGNDKTVKVFPNPGKVPTEFVFGNRTDRYSPEAWLDEHSPTKCVRDIVRSGIFGSATGKDVSYFPIGGIDPAKISAELKNEHTSVARLEQIRDSWKCFVSIYDGLTLEMAVRKVVREEIQRLPNVDGLGEGSSEDKINYYSELFGCFGFGTGGFKSIQKTSLAEMMRLLLWDYSNEFSLPEEVKENVEFVKELFLKSIRNGLYVKTKKARVCDVCHSGRNGKALVFSYSTDPDDKNTQSAAKMDEYDFVILAIPPKQLNSMISRAGFSNTAAKFIRFGDHNRPHEQDILARPPLVLSKAFDGPNAEIFTAVNQAHLITSSKIFLTMTKEDLLKYAPKFNGTEEKHAIKAIVSDCGLASTYFVPSPIFEKNAKKAKKGDPVYYSLMLSYNWEEDTKRMQHQFFQYPINKDASDENKKMIEAAIERTVRHVKDPETGEYKPWWFGELLRNAKLSDGLSHDWTTDYTAGAFKLDTPGCQYNSSLCFRYHTHALDCSLDNRFFLAGDSYSHLGGWIEGAFISAVNAVTGLVTAANHGRVNCLTPEARKVILSLDNVVRYPIE
ncbi:phenylalanine 2-monooxygenase precursor-like [Planococcus citri]|uniref:phenylalanine 2-monooxygenase precursor-like n=1 Tax=Planococcus citri TaxID=170843 RepID=UPI0031F7FFE8